MNDIQTDLSMRVDSIAAPKLFPLADRSALILTSPESDNSIRWPAGVRLDRLFEERLTDASVASTAAVDCGGKITSFRDLDRLANRLARHLIGKGVGGGDRVAILLSGTPEAYGSMLAVMKIGAAYVPLDAGFPKDRIGFILADAGVTCAMTLSRHADLVAADGVIVMELDSEADAIAGRNDAALSDAERSEPVGDLCYIIYTSGTTGRPKGVQIDHRAICNFISVAAETYGLAAGARMYQGLTIAFDFSVEEIWVPLFVGATLVPAPGEGSLVGHDLAAFLEENKITALCCVPTLLATIDADLPALNFLLVSGEACPRDLVMRWHRAGRIFLNAYGPTEATVTATLARVSPERPVTIGTPLPTYSVAILDPENPVALPKGALGEIALAGVGLSRGYLNRDDLTRRAFVDDFIGMPDNPTGKLYRTGDLGRINDAGEIEYAGRIDTQVKIRGYRIELAEIESVLMQTPEIAQAVVDIHKPDPDTIELVAYYALRDAAAPVRHERLAADMKERLPSYMVPAFYERLDIIPMLPSNKADRKALPVPTGRRLAITGANFEPPASPTESLVASVLAKVLKLEQVSVTDHFFEDLGANSLMIARVCAGLRERLPGAAIAMKDMYLNPDIRRVARHIDQDTDTHVLLPPSPAPLRASTAAYYACGAMQAAAYFLYLCLLAFGAIEGLSWVEGAGSAGAVYLRSAAFGVFAFATLSLVPVCLKWLLIGRWRADRFAIWSAHYFRFWLVKSAIRTSPMTLFAGTPVYSFYLRLLGARIGRNVIILAPQLPVATDLLSIGDDSVIRADVHFPGYRAEAGGIEIGAIRIGRDAYVGDGSVLDIGVEIGDGGQLGHASSLQTGQTIAKGRARHGSPAVDCATEFRLDSAIKPDPSRRFAFTVFQLLTLFAVTLPAPSLVLVWLHRAEATDASHFNPFNGFGNPISSSLAVYFGLLAVGLIAVAVIPRVLGLVVREGQDYPLYGVHFEAQRLIAFWSNSTLYNAIFGDSSYIVYYLRWIGYRLARGDQTGSNFGLVQKHETPFLCEIGKGTLVSDGLSMVNLEVSNAAFRLTRTRIGSGNFLGNSVIYPSGGRTGDNCLLATKVMIPRDGPVRENVGLLGSPSFEIPRSVRRDHRFDHLKAPGVFEKRLAAKDRSNLATIGLYLLSRWFLFLVAWLVAEATFNPHGVYGAVTIAFGGLGLTIFTVAYFVFIERLSLGFGRLQPQFCSIYDDYYWRHERYWKLNDTSFITVFNGTPFKNLIWKLLGVTWGRRNFDNGCSITERTLVTVGDYCTFGELSTLQSHSLEDGVFKSDHVRIASGSTIGARAYVSYGVTIEGGATLDPDSFLMKGETVAAGSLWRGNPARMARP